MRGRLIFRSCALILLSLWISAKAVYGADPPLLLGLQHAIQSPDPEIRLYALKKVFRCQHEANDTIAAPPRWRYDFQVRHLLPCDSELARRIGNDSQLISVLQQCLSSTIEEEVNIALEAVIYLGPAASYLTDAVVKHSKDRTADAELITTALARLNNAKSVDELRRQLLDAKDLGDVFAFDGWWRATLAAAAENRSLDVGEIGRMLQQSHELVPAPPDQQWRPAVVADSQALTLVLGTYGVEARPYAGLLSPLDEPSARAFLAIGPEHIPFLKDLAQWQAVPISAGLDNRPIPLTPREWALRVLVAHGAPADASLLAILEDPSVDRQVEACLTLILPRLTPPTSTTIRNDLMIRASQQSSPHNLPRRATNDFERFLLLRFRFEGDIEWIAEQRESLPRTPAVASSSPAVKKRVAKILDDYCQRFLKTEPPRISEEEFLDAVVGIAACDIEEIPATLLTVLKERYAEMQELRSDLLLVASLFSIPESEVKQLSQLPTSNNKASGQFVPLGRNGGRLPIRPDYISSGQVSLLATILANGTKGAFNGLELDEHTDRVLYSLIAGLQEGKVGKAGDVLIQNMQEITNSASDDEVTTLEWSLSKMPNATKNALIANAKRKDNPLSRWVSIRALGQIAIPDTDIDETLTEIMNGPDNENSVVASIALTFRSNPICISKLVAMTESPSDVVRDAAVNGLGRLGKKAKAAVPLLVQYADTHRRDDYIGPHVPWVAIDEIGVAEEEQIPVLRNAILSLRMEENGYGNSQRENRVEIATDVIVQSTSKPAAALLRLLEHPDGWVRSHVAGRLERLAPFDRSTILVLLDAALGNQSDRSGPRLKFFSYLADPDTLGSKPTESDGTVLLSASDVFRMLAPVAVPAAFVPVESPQSASAATPKDADGRLRRLLWLYKESADNKAWRLARWTAERIDSEIQQNKGKWSNFDLLKDAVKLLKPHHEPFSALAQGEMDRISRLKKWPPWMQTGLAIGFVNLIALLLLTIQPDGSGLIRWVPFLSYVGLGSSSMVAPFVGPFSLNVGVLGGVLGGQLVCLIALGVVSPAMLRQIAKIEPLNRVAVPLALNLPWSRRRLYRDYVRRVYNELKRDTENADNEQYIALSAKTRSHGNRISAEVPEPAVDICNFLSGSTCERGHVLIESPGGRGKSALLRQVVWKMLENYKASTKYPLPVLLTGKAENLEKLVESTLAGVLVVPELLPQQLQAGDFFLVLDGASESGISDDTLRQFVRGLYGDTTPLLLSSRPTDSYRQVIEGTAEWIVVEPLQLDEASLEQFIRNYGGGELPESLRAACRGRDGSYLPILVRMAMTLAGDKCETATVADIYRGYFSRLYKKQFPNDADRFEELRQAARWCLETYWRDGLRRRTYDGNKLQQRLLQAGVLIPADHREPPKEVQFIHDSMQSYLTAFALAAEDYSAYKNIPEPADGVPDMTWNRSRILLWAAANPKFVRTHNGALQTGGTELFQMCLATFTPIQDLRNWLRDELRSWAEELEENLRKKDVFQAVPEPLKSRVQKVRGAAQLLRQATEECTADDEITNSVAMLGIFYSGLAPLVYELKEESTD